MVQELYYKRNKESHKKSYIYINRFTPCTSLVLSSDMSLLNMNKASITINYSMNNNSCFIENIVCS